MSSYRLLRLTTAAGTGCSNFHICSHLSFMHLHGETEVRGDSRVSSRAGAWEVVSEDVLHKWKLWHVFYGPKKAIPSVSVLTPHGLWAS